MSRQTTEPAAKGARPRRDVVRVPEGRPARRLLGACLLCAVTFATLLAPAGVCAERWLRLDSPAFTVVGAVDEGTLGDVATRLEQFRAVFIRLFPSTPRVPPVPTVVVVYPNERAYRPFYPLNKGKVVPVGGMFIPGPDVDYITLNVEQQAYVFRIIYHEIAHSIINGAIRSIPLWLSEGLAEYYSTFEGTKAGDRAYVGRPVPEHVQLLRDSRLLPLDQLMTVNHASSIYNESDRRGVFYAESWAVVHYLLLGNDARSGQLRTFVDHLAAGAPEAQAFRDAFACDPATLERELDAYVHQVMFAGQTFVFKAPIVLDRAKRATPVASADVEALLGDVLCHMGRPIDGRARLEAVLRTEPENARAHAGLGAAAAREGRLDDAIAELRKAAAGLPDDPSVQHALGTSALRSLLQRGQPEAADPLLDTAREALAKAVSLRPGFADALANLGRAQMVANVRLQEAFDLIAQARTLSPAHDEYVLYAAEVRARQGKYAEARDLVGPILAGGAGESLKTTARSFMGAVAAQENARQAAQDAGNDGGTKPSTEPEAGAARSSDTSSKAKLVPLFRQTRDGEQRAFGTFQALECSPTPVALRVHAADRILRLLVRAMDKVELISYRDDAKGAVRCGIQSPAFEAWVTWRAIEGTPPRGGPFDGEVVAVEIVPKDYAPPARR